MSSEVDADLSGSQVSLTSSRFRNDSKDIGNTNGEHDPDDEGEGLAQTSLQRTATITPANSSNPAGEKRYGDLHGEGPGDGTAEDAANEHEAGGIRWAPLNVGIRRRLQTLMVLYHTITIPIFLTAFFFSCAVPLFWPLLLPYLISILLFSRNAVSGSLSRRSEYLRSLRFWRYFAEYFPVTLYKTEDLPSTGRYLFGYHPHGIISHGAFAAFGTEACNFSKMFPGITNTLLTLDSNFRLPFYRDYALAMGLASVARESCENLLTTGGHDGKGRGRAITIVIGGARESLDALPGSLRLTLRRRRGFIKMAVRTGADLVPVLALGENEIYDQVASHQHPLIHTLQMWVKKCMGFTIPLFHARGVFNYDVGLMPYRRPIRIIVGQPIRVSQNSGQVDEKYVTVLQDKYIEELRRLFNVGKERGFVGQDIEMEIVDIICGLGWAFVRTIISGVYQIDQ